MSDYIVKALPVRAFPYQLGMEDGMVARSVNTRGRPFVRTPNGDQFIFEGNEDNPPDWVIIYPGGVKEVVSHRIFVERYEEPPVVIVQKPKKQGKK